MRVVIQRGEFERIKMKIFAASQQLLGGHIIYAYNELEEVRSLLAKIAWQLEPKQKKR